MKNSLKTLFLIFVIFCFSWNLFIPRALYADEEIASQEEKDDGVMPVSAPSGISGKRGINRAVTIDVDVSIPSEDDSQSADGTVRVTYSKSKKGFVYTKDGEELEVSLQEVFGSEEESFLAFLGIKDGDELALTFAIADGKTVCFLAKYKSETQSKEWEYDVSSRQAVYFHTEGPVAGKPDYVVQENGGWFRWADSNSADVEHQNQIIHTGLHNSEGRQFTEHFLAQKYFYNTEGNLARVEFYTSTGGIGSEIGSAKVYGRYTYRVDTYGPAGQKINTVYYNDPYPGNWDPDIRGVIVRDSFGRYFLQENDGIKWLILSRQEWALDGASFLNALILDQLAADGTMIELSGHEYNNDTIYFDRKKARILAVTKGEVIPPIPQETLQPRVINKFINFQSTPESLWHAENGNIQSLEIIIDHEDPQNRAISWGWTKANSVGFGWGRVFPDNSVLANENLGDLILRFVVSGDSGSDFTVIFEDNAKVREVNGIPVGQEIFVKVSDYVTIDSNQQVAAIPLDKLVSLNPEFNWAALKQVKFNPEGENGKVILQQLQIEDVSGTRSRGVGLAIFQDNNFTPINDWHGIKPAFIMSFKNLFDIVREDILSQLQGVSNNNQVPYLTLEFWQMEQKSPEDMQEEREKFVQRYGEGVYENVLADMHNSNILSGIKNGVYDVIIRDYAKAAAALGEPMLFRPFHEFNGSWYPWVTEGSNEDDFVSAWNKVYGIFQEEAAANVSFVFSPYSLNLAGYDAVERILSLLKDKINIIALDGYGPSPENPQGANFNGLFTELISLLKKYNFPFMIGEFGSELDKTEFYQAMDRELRNGAFPQIAALTYFDIAKFERGQWRDFKVDTVADLIQNMQQDQFYRLGAEPTLEYVKAYDQYAHYYWGGVLSDMRAEGPIDSGGGEAKHIIASVSNNILSITISSSAGSQAYTLDLVSGILRAAGQEITPSLNPAQYLENINKMHQLISDFAVSAAGDVKQSSLAVANYLKAIIYRFENPDGSQVVMPFFPSTGTTDPNGKINIIFQNNTTLFSGQLSEFWAEVKYDGKTEYWHLTPEMISSDGKSLSMEFSSDFDGKSVTARFYGFDKSGKQTGFSNPIAILVDSNLSGLAMPELPASGVTESNGKINISFQNNTTLLPGQLSGFWAQVTYDGKTEYWELHPSMIALDGKSLDMQFNSGFDGKTVLVRFYGFDLAGKQTNFTNQITIAIVSTPSAVVMPVLPGAADTDSNRNAAIAFVSGTLFASQITDLWAVVSYDGKIEYWDLDPSMLAPDGTAILIQFAAGFSGKTIRMQFYGFDPIGRQTTFTNPIDIHVH